MNRHDDSETKEQYMTFYLQAAKSIEKLIRLGEAKPPDFPYLLYRIFVDEKEKEGHWVLIPQSRDPHCPPFEDYGVE
jgi:hypothetical protein